MIRKLNRKKYHRVLLVEWLSSFARSKTNRKEKERKYWEKICKLKKDKILSLSLELGVGHPFNSVEEVNSFIENNLYDKNTNLPRFQYKETDENVEQYRLSDLFGFYAPETEINLLDFPNSVDSFKITWFDFNGVEVRILNTTTHESFWCPVHKIRRKLVYNEGE